MKIPNGRHQLRSRHLSLARIVSEDSQHKRYMEILLSKSSKDS